MGVRAAEAPGGAGGGPPGEADVGEANGNPAIRKGGDRLLKVRPPNEKWTVHASIAAR